MKAVVQHRYGAPDVVRVEDIDKPVPRDDEILIRVRAASVSQSDSHARTANPFFWRLVRGLRRPRWGTLGVDLAGEVEAVGRGTTEFKVGDSVFGSPSSYFGSHAEYVCSRETAALAIKPEQMSFEEAAAVYDGGTQALSALHQAEAKPGRRILIHGASGSLGTAAVQLAKHFGADVTAVCSTRHIELVRSLGADEVIDRLERDFTTTGQKWDAIIDAVGKTTYRRSRRALRPGGVFVATDGLENIVVWVGMKLTRNKRLRFASGRRSKDEIRLFKQLIEDGAYRAVVDRVYPMDQAADAHRYVEAWRKAGNVVLTIP